MEMNAKENDKRPRHEAQAKKKKKTYQIEFDGKSGDDMNEEKEVNEERNVKKDAENKDEGDPRGVGLRPQKEGINICDPVFCTVALARERSWLQLHWLRPVSNCVYS